MKKDVRNNERLSFVFIGFIIAQVGIAITGPIVSKKLNDMKAWIGANVFHKVQDCCAVPALPEGESTMEPGETSFEEIQPRYHRIGFVHNDGRIW